MKIWKEFKEFNLFFWHNPNPLGKINLILGYAIPIAMIISYLIIEG